MDEHSIAFVKRLYRAMPGAPHVPNPDGFEQWGEVEGNEHWQFCEEIVRQIINAAQAYAH